MSWLTRLVALLFAVDLDACPLAPVVETPDGQVIWLDEWRSRRP